MAFLYDDLNGARKYGGLKSVPDFVAANLNPAFELRPYQRAALENFITHFESSTCPNPTQVLFHMATGSGKTLIMAGLILYLYGRGYRNFLFFVNLTNIVDKTRDNFLNAASSKYLFSESITIDGERVRVNVVENFQRTDSDAINICFTTTQALHDKLNPLNTREGAMTLDDFDGRKVVLISDEAHHLNVSTKSADKDNRRTWEETVKHIFRRDADNVLLEFTATCDLNNASIRREYEPLIVYDYPLLKFHNDRYSKEIFTLRTDLSPWRKALVALVLSQYRLKIFQAHRLKVKPVVLFKAAKISDSENFMAEFLRGVKNLRGDELRELSALDNDIVRKAFDYFAERGISADDLAAELRDDFAEAHCISANDDKDATANQISLNSLEDAGNPYRAIFEVKKLDEGWDVLNLFDIVRLYETRQSGGKKISPATISEAQLIGRGARYCPFQVDAEQPKYQRKFDGDASNELRICETLYYHCQNDHRYVDELHCALREIGLEADRAAQTYRLKEIFKRDELYQRGVIYVNGREEIRRDFGEFVPSSPHEFRRVVGKSGRDKILADAVESVDARAELHSESVTIGAVAARNYAVVHKALRKFPTFKFAALKSRFPNLQSTRQFITDENFLGDVRIDITTDERQASLETLYAATSAALKKISDALNQPAQIYCGTTKFYPQNIRDTFRDKTVNFSETIAGGNGTSQNDLSVGKSRLDLSAADWFAYNDNFGTSEEKSFVEYFSRHVEELRKIYRKVWLVRNERAVKIFAFDDGARFEPDYVLFLQREVGDDLEHYQIFIEPKGEHLTAADAWKEDFLRQLQSRAVAVKIFADEPDCKIWGLPFFNRGDALATFDSAFRELFEP